MRMFFGEEEIRNPHGIRKEETNFGWKVEI
jgi:hypothetical protein